MSRPLEFDNELRFPSDTHTGLRVQEQILEELRRHDYSERALFGVRLALEEALINAIKHGNQRDPSKHVRVSYTVNTLHVLIEIEDEGPGFDPEGVPDPTSPENLDRPSGRGVLLMRAYMTECDFLERGNVCRMRLLRDD